jgi:hypothetical protein
MEYQNSERRQRTAVYVMIVTEEMPEWEDSMKIGKFIHYLWTDDVASILFEIAILFFRSEATVVYSGGGNWEVGHAQAPPVELPGSLATPKTP